MEKTQRGKDPCNAVLAKLVHVGTKEEVEKKFPNFCQYFENTDAISGTSTYVPSEHWESVWKKKRKREVNQKKGKKDGGKKGNIFFFPLSFLFIQIFFVFFFLFFFFNILFLRKRRCCY